MKRKNAVIFLLFFAITGAFMTFYSVNLLMSDLSNMYYASPSKDILSSLPAFAFALVPVCSALFTLRLYCHPERRKALLRNFLCILAALALIGFVSAVLTGALVYGSFLTPYPFPGYTLIGILVHAFLLAAAIYLLRRSKDLPEDENSDSRTLPRRILYGIYTLLLLVLLVFSFDRFGALLWAPVYAQARTLNLTFPFYLSLPLPIFLLAAQTLRLLGFFEKRPKAALYVPAALLVIDLVLGSLVLFDRQKMPLFVSAVSPALALDRLATTPYIVTAHFVITSALGLGLFACHAVKLLKNKKQSS